jgi:hypothetical protein
MNDLGIRDLVAPREERKHNRVRSICKDCGSDSICEHNRQSPKPEAQVQRESVLFIGTHFSNFYTAVDTPARGRVGLLRTEGAPPSASITDRGANARTAGAPPSASICKDCVDTSSEWVGCKS